VTIATEIAFCADGGRQRAARPGMTPRRHRRFRRLRFAIFTLTVFRDSTVAPLRRPAASSAHCSGGDFMR